MKLKSILVTVLAFFIFFSCGNEKEQDVVNTVQEAEFDYNVE